jgi:hypothetical protein
VLLVTAEAGIGKSRFAAEAERLAAGYDVGAGRFAAHTGARVLSVHCVAFGERRRLAPLADLVRAAVGLPTDAATAVTRPAVEERLRRLGQRLARLRPGPTPVATDQLLALLGYAELPARTAPPPTTASGTRPPPPADAEVVPAAWPSCSAGSPPRRRWWWCRRPARRHPETVKALGDPSRLTGPVLVLLLGRPELVRPAGALTRVADAEVHALPPLRGADAARLLTSYLGGGRLPQADTDRLLATAQGNPFYLAELVTLLMERGALTAVADRNTPGPGTWRLAPGSLGSRLLSRDLAAVLAARIDASRRRPLRARDAARGRRHVPPAPGGAA